MAWITLLVVGGWAALFIIDINEFGTRDVAILSVLLGVAFLTFAVDSMMEKNPEYMKKYFLHWLLAFGLFMFFGLTIWAWFSLG